MINGLLAQLNALMVGTKDLDVVVSSLKFIHLTAEHMQQRDQEFSVEEAIDFMLIVFVKVECLEKKHTTYRATKTLPFQRINIYETGLCLV